MSARSHGYHIDPLDSNCLEQQDRHSSEISRVHPVLHKHLDPSRFPRSILELLVPVGDTRGRLGTGRLHLLRRRPDPSTHNPREESHRLCTRIPGILLRGTPHASGASENNQAARGARRGPRIESEQSGRLVRGPGREDFGRSAVGAGRLRCGARSDHRDRGAARRVGNGLK